MNCNNLCIISSHVILLALLLLAPIHNSLAEESNLQSIQEYKDDVIKNTAQLQIRTQNQINTITTTDKDYRAVIAIDPSLSDQVKTIQDKPAAEKLAMALTGVPVLLKDNIETNSQPTTAGSLALADNHTNRDADLVVRLKQAGALILGKTNLSEWANFRSEHSISGWSGVGGQTRNAVETNRSPCGSSSGSAVAVALGYVPVAIGTETNGSVVCPAAVNGIVGIKPTHGLVSGNGIVPLASTQDTAGPMANNIEDAARTLAVMIKPANKEAKAVINGLNNVKKLNGLNGKKIGVLKSAMGFDNRRDELLLHGMTILGEINAEIIQGLELTPYNDFRTDSYDVLLYEFKRDLNDYLASLPNELNDLTLAKIIRFNNEHADKELVYFDQSIFELSENLEITEKDYLDKLDKIKTATRTDGLDKLFDEHKLDALIGITLGPAWVIDNINGDAFFGPSVSTYPAIAGNPHITLPVGTIGGLPIGISFIGKRNRDHELAQLAYQFEKAIAQTK